MKVTEVIYSTIVGIFLLSMALWFGGCSIPAANNSKAEREKCERLHGHLVHEKGEFKCVWGLGK